MGSLHSKIRSQIERGVKSGTHDWYIKEKKLGDGGYGDVYLCRLKISRHYFALKVVDMKKNAGAVQFDDIVENVGKFSLNHQNIINYYFKQSTQDACYIYMEYAAYGPLSHLSQEQGGLIDRQTGLYTKQILLGLQYLHNQKIIHRDIKCDNILLCSPIVVKLCDFGIARSLSKERRHFSTKCGTAYFMAPEVKAGREYAFSADIWSLGATVLEMKLGEVPNQLNNLLDNASPLQYYEKHFDFSDCVMEFLNSCLIKRNKRRKSTTQLLDLKLCKLQEFDDDTMVDIIEFFKAQNKFVKDYPCKGSNDDNNKSVFDVFLEELENELAVEVKSSALTTQAENVNKQFRKEIKAVIQSDLQGDEIWYDEKLHLGKGAFGEVIICQTIEKRHFFALKSIDSRFDPVALQRLENLGAHDHLIDIYAMKVRSGCFNIFSEYAEYGSLADFYQRNGSLIDQQVGQYIKQVLLALQHLQEQHITHGDIKCENILLVKPGIVKLSDHGLAEVLVERMDRFHSFTGCRSFLAPEVNFGQEFTESADIWSVGAVVLEMKLGALPDQLNNLLDGSDPIKYYLSKNHFSGIVKEFLEACMQKGTQRRATLQELLKKSLCNPPNFSEEEILTIIEGLKKCIELTRQLIPCYLSWRSLHGQIMEKLSNAANFRHLKLAKKEVSNMLIKEEEALNCLITKMKNMFSKLLEENLLNKLHYLFSTNCDFIESGLFTLFYPKLHEEQKVKALNLDALLHFMRNEMNLILDIPPGNSNEQQSNKLRIEAQKMQEKMQKMESFYHSIVLNPLHLNEFYNNRRRTIPEVNSTQDSVTFLGIINPTEQSDSKSQQNDSTTAEVKDSNHSMNQLEQSDQALKCIQCKQNSPDCLLLPCQHLCICTVCAQNIQNCPTCTSQISNTIPIKLDIIH